MDDKAKWKQSGARLKDKDSGRAHWDWKLVRSTKTGYKAVAATNGAVTHDNSYAYTTYITNATADIVLTVPDGTTPGENITIKLHTLDTNNVVVTPTTFHDGSTVTLDATNDSCTLFWSGATDGWMLEVNNGGTLA